MICPNCHTDNRANAKYCDECGYELPTVAPIANEIFGYGHDAQADDETLAFNGLDQIVDSSYDPYVDNDHLEDRADITRPFAVPPSAQQRRAFIGTGPEVMGSRPISHDEAARFAASQTGAHMPVQGNMGNPYGDTGGAPPKGPFSKKAKAGKPKDPASRRSIARKARIAAIVILCLAILGGIAAAVTYSMQMWGGKVVPDVVGMQSNVAKAELESMGFTVEVVQVKSDEIENIVLSTDPEYGARVDEGSTIRLNVSVARVVPELIGLSREDADKLLKQEGFTNIEYVEITSNEEEGTIIGCSPGEGTRAKGDAKITLEVAVPFRVPEVAGMSADEARAKLEEQGYKVTTKEVYAEDVQEGYAVSTDPAAGSALPTGSDVTLNLAKHRSAELVSLTRSFLKAHDKVKINGINYEISEISKVTYTSDNTCSYTIVARKYETNTWAIFGQTETRYGNPETISGTIKWNDSNEIASMDPEIKEA